MLISISISETATFQEKSHELENFSKINFVFGNNGSGKTTISRVIAGFEQYPTCTLTWKNNTPLQTMVYNRDFVEKNYKELKGVFTLGEDNKGILDKIEEIKIDCDKLIDKINNLNRNEDIKKDDLTKLNNIFKEKCWTQAQKHSKKLKKALQSFLGSKEKFKEKILNEYQYNQADLLTIKELEEKSASVFEKNLSKENIITVADFHALRGYENNPILKKCVIGKDDVDIAAMIKKLGNSDWVRLGKTYFNSNDNICPFVSSLLMRRLEIVSMSILMKLLRMTLNPLSS